VAEEFAFPYSLFRRSGCSASMGSTGDLPCSPPSSQGFFEIRGSQAVTFRQHPHNIIVVSVPTRCAQYRRQTHFLSHSSYVWFISHQLRSHSHSRLSLDRFSRAASYSRRCPSSTAKPSMIALFWGSCLGPPFLSPVAVARGRYSLLARLFSGSCEAGYVSIFFSLVFFFVFFFSLIPRSRLLFFQ